jgi:hypothetical protein
VKCPCGSTNVEHLAHWLNTLHPTSPHHDTYAQPADARIQVVGVLLLAGIGVAMLASGAWFGLLAVLGAGLWAMAGYRQVEAAEMARAVWASSLICHVCTKAFQP